MLKWAGDSRTSLDELSHQVFTPGREGSFQADLLAASRRHGMLAVSVHHLRDLLGELAAGEPVLILQNLGLSWYSRWHYAVAVGYDLDHDQISLHSGSDHSELMDLGTFEHTWDRGGDWGLVILPPHHLPVLLPERDIVDAAAGLELAGQWIAAEAAYRQILKRWPHSLEARIGLANTRYAAHDLKNVIVELQVAVADHPRAAPAWHNLAIALNEDRRLEEACVAAHKALETVDPSGLDAYLVSMRAIVGQRQDRGFQKE